MLKAVLTPPNMQPVKLWAGLYGGHYDMIVFFNKKPTHRMTERDDPRANGKYVDCLAEFESGNIYADMGTGNFEAWFPNVDLSPYLQENSRPKDTEILYSDLFEIELTVPLDEYGNIEELRCTNDWR